MVISEKQAHYLTLEGPFHSQNDYFKDES